MPIRIQKVLGLLLSIVYLVALLQPVIPLIEYHWNKGYIISVLCENNSNAELECEGTCYLNKRLFGESRPSSSRGTETSSENRTLKLQEHLGGYNMPVVWEYDYIFLDLFSQLFPDQIFGSPPTPPPRST